LRRPSFVFFGATSKMFVVESESASDSTTLSVGETSKSQSSIDGHRPVLFIDVVRGKGFGVYWVGAAPFHQLDVLSTRYRV
jgi:hypothetical protein